MADGGKVIIKIDGDDSGFNKTTRGIKSGAAKAFKAIGVGAAAVGAAVVAIGKSAISAYADYEQLVGGVETLFKENASAVIENANNAFRTAGMSTNQYMDTVTSFSASLLQSLDGDTALAVQKADMAITDMSDNANKMGTNIGMIQDAYQGFAKQNFTMLDNLKLGYGGTKTEMERLLADAEAIKAKQGEVADYSIDSYADIVDAIHVVQTEMGITGTTAEESSSTIQGSLNTTKAAWKNLMTGLTDPSQDFDQLMNDFLQSVTTFGENLMPRIGNVLQGIAQMFSTLAPQLIAMVTDMLPQILPVIAQGVTAVSTALIDAFPLILDAVVSLLPMLIDAAMQLFNSLVEALPNLVQTIVTALPTIIPQLIDGIVSTVMMIVEMLPEIIQPIIESLPNLITSVVEALISNLPIIIAGLVQLIAALVVALPQILMALGEALVTLFTDMFKAAWEAIKNIFAHVDEYFGTNFSAALKAVEVVWDVAVAYFKLVWEGIKAVFSVVATFFKGMFSAAFTAIKAVWDTVTGYFKAIWDTVAGIFSVVRAVLSGDFSEAWEAIKGIVGTWAEFFSGVWESIKSVFSAVASWFGSTFEAGWNAIKNVFSAVGQFFQNVWTTIKNAFHISDMFNIGKNIIEGLWNGISSMVGWIVGKVKGVVSSIKNVFTGIAGFDTHSPSKWSGKVAKNVIIGFGNGIEENSNYAIHAVESLTEDVKTEVEKAAEEIAKASEDITKNMTEEEKKLFEALQKDIENNKKAIQDTFKEITASAFDSIEELEKAQKNLEDKLKGYGTLVANIKIKNEVSGEEKTLVTLGDLKAQTAALEKYEDTLLRVKERGNVPAEFFEVIRDMDMDEAMTFADLLLSASDEEFDEFIKDWTTQQETAARIAKEFYRDEAEELSASLSAQFEKTPEQFFELGEESIKQFGDGFMEM